MDQIGRSLRHLVDLAGDLRSRKIGFRSLNDPIDTTSASGRLVVPVFAPLAEFERDLTRKRTAAGLAATRARGRVGGRPRVMIPEKIRLAQRLYDEGGVTVHQIANTLGVSRRRSIYRSVTVESCPGGCSQPEGWPVRSSLGYQPFAQSGCARRHRL